jgi:hypothetical protein
MQPWCFTRSTARRGHTFHEGHNAEGELVARCLHDGETLTGVLRGHRVLELSVCGKWERDSSESNEQAENIIKSTSPSRAAFSLLRHPPPWFHRQKLQLKRGWTLPEFAACSPRRSER